ncbi:MAG TPA: hypothetical protein DHV55_01225 [Clostridiaceae bacterium]|nr:hypothetical protein [Clostridiaceae bacterium]
MPLSADDFLCECRLLIDARQVDLFLNDADNRATVNLLSYSVRNVLQELRDLEASNLHSGPVPDNNSKYPGEVFIFKKSIGGYLLYIKLKIREVNGRKQLFMMSFHPDRP